MGTGVDVGIDPQRDRRDHTPLRGHLLQPFQLVGGFDVEAVHAHFQGAAHVVTGLADAGEHHPVRIATGGQDALQFTAGNDVEAGAEAGQDIEHAEVGVGLDGKADQVRQTGQRIGIGAVLALDVRSRIDVGGGAEFLRHGAQGYPFRMQFSCTDSEDFHGGSLEHVVAVFFGGFLVVGQVQRAFLTAAGQQAGAGDEEKRQALHDAKPLFRRILPGV